MVCYKCGKTGHKAFKCKTEQKINDLFSGDPEPKQKLLALLTKHASGSEAEDDYYAKSSDGFEYESSPIQALNVITSKSPKEFLIELIGQIPDLDTKREYLERLKGIILEQDRPPKFNLEAASSSSITKIFER